MKKSKKLMLASAAALVALTATSLTACGDLTDDVHYHSGTAYEHDDSQHWNVCDEDGEKVSGTEAAHEITELNVKTMPLKTEYLAGETFDATGLELEGVCVCGTLAVPIDEVVFDKTVLSAEDTEVTVSYNGLTATIRVTVTKDTRSVSTPTIEGWTYGETANEPSCETEGVSFEYATSISAEEWSAEKPVNAGTYFVRAYIAEDDIYEAAVSVAAKFVIEKAKIAIPQKGEASYVYSGEEITFAKEGEGYTVSGNKGTNAGNYTVTFTLIDNENTEWADEFDGEYTYTIEKAKIAVPSQGTVSYAYTGEEITFIEGAEGYTVSGNKGTNAGNYTVTFTLIDDKNTEWADEFDGEYTYTIERIKITAPSQGTVSYAYTGEEITFIEGAEGYTVSGNKGTNAGNYTVTLTLSDENYDWADGFEGVYVYTIEKMAEKQLAAADFDLNMNLSAVGTGKIAIDLGEEVVAENIAVKVGDVTVSGEDVTLDGTVLSVNAAAFGKIYGENNVKIETTNRDFEVLATFVSKIAKTAEDFKNMALISRAMGQGGLFRLGADIDLQNENLYNVDENLDYRFGVKNHFVANNRNYVNYELFKGVIDGCGHSVSNMFIGDNNYAWIQCMAEGAELKNISFVGFGFQTNCSLVYGYFANNYPSGTPGGLIENVYIATSELAFKSFGSYGAVLGSSDAITNMTIRNVVVDFTASEADMKTHGVENPANTTNKALGVYENCKIENVAVLGLATRWATSVLIVRKDGVNAKSDGVGEGVYVEYIDGTNNGVLRTRNWNGVMSDMLPSATLEKLNEPNVLSRANLTIDGEKELNVGVENGNLTNDKAVALSLQGAAISGEFKHVIIDGTKVTSATLDGETLTIPALAAAKLYGTKAIDVVFADENGDYNVLAVTATYVSKMIKTTEEFLSIGKISKALNFGGYFKLANDLNIVDENNTAIDIFNNDPEKDAIIGMVKHTVNDAGKTTRVDYAPFVGIIDGNGYTVRNLRVVGDAIAQLGNYSWIKALGNGGVLRNIAINLTYNSNCALIYGDNYASGGLVENVYVNVEYNSAWETAYNAIFGSSDDMLKTTFRNVVVNFNGRLATADNAHANRKAFAKTNGATFENVALLGVNDTYKNAVMIVDGAKSNGNAQGIYVEFTDGTTNGVVRPRVWNAMMKKVLPSAIYDKLTDYYSVKEQLADIETNLDVTANNGNLSAGADLVITVGAENLTDVKSVTVGGKAVTATVDGDKLVIPGASVAELYGAQKVVIKTMFGEDTVKEFTLTATLTTKMIKTTEEFLSIGKISKALNFGGYFKLANDLNIVDENNTAIDIFNNDPEKDAMIGMVKHTVNDAGKTTRVDYAPFVGIIDGNGHTVRNLRVVSDAIAQLGNYSWIRALGNGGVLRNIAINLTYNANCALIYGDNYASGGLIENVYVNVEYNSAWDTAYNAIFGSSDDMLKTTFRNVVVNFNGRLATADNANANRKAFAKTNGATFENVALLGVNDTYKNAVMIADGAKSNGNAQGIYVEFTDGTTNGVLRTRNWTSPMTEILPSSVLEELNKANTIEVKTIDHGDTNLKLTVSGDTVVNSVNGVYNLGETEYGTFKKATIDGAEIAGATLNNGELTLPADKIATIYGDKQIKVLFEKEGGDFNQVTVNTTFVSATATKADEFKNMALISRAMGQGGYFKLGANIELDGSNLYNDDADLDYRFGVVNHYVYNNSTRVNYAPFVGTIDGCGYTVKNITVTGNNYAWVQSLGNGGTIKNIAIDGFTYNANCALVYGNNSASGGIIENVYVKASYQGNWNHASIFGSSDKMIGTTVKNVVVEFTKASSDKMASSGAENANYKALGLFENSTFENVAILGLATRWNTSVLINNGAKSTGVGEGIYVQFVDGTTNGVTLPETWDTTYWTVENGTVSWKAKA